MIEEIDSLIEKEVIEKTEKQKAEKKKRRRGRKSTKKKYFTLETQNAIVLFNILGEDLEELKKMIELSEDASEGNEHFLSEDDKRAIEYRIDYRERVEETYPRLHKERARNILYRDHIKYPLEKIAENIYNTYKFSYFDSTPQQVQTEVVHDLLLNLHKYDDTKGSKAFSYFSVVAKNYLIQKNNNNYRYYKRSSLLSTMPETWEVEDNFDVRQRHKDSAEFKRLMLGFWQDNLRNVFTKERDIKIADSILEQFRRSEYLDNFNKKAIYTNIREITGIEKTQYITKVVKKMREIQNKMLEEFRSVGNIDKLREDIEAEYTW